MEPDLWDQLISIITVMNSGDTWLFHSLFCAVFFSDIEQNKVTLPHSAQQKHAFVVKTKKSQNQKRKSLKRIFLGLLHQRLGHRSTINAQ